MNWFHWMRGLVLFWRMMGKWWGKLTGRFLSLFTVETILYTRGDENQDEGKWES